MGFTAFRRATPMALVVGVLFVSSCAIHEPAGPARLEPDAAVRVTFASPRVVSTGANAADTVSVVSLVSRVRRVGSDSAFVFVTSARLADGGSTGRLDGLMVPVELDGDAAIEVLRRNASWTDAVIVGSLTLYAALGLLILATGGWH